MPRTRRTLSRVVLALGAVVIVSPHPAIGDPVASQTGAASDSPSWSPNWNNLADILFPQDDPSQPPGQAARASAGNHSDPSTIPVYVDLTGPGDQADAREIFNGGVPVMLIFDTPSGILGGWNADPPLGSAFNPLKIQDPGEDTEPVGYMWKGRGGDGSDTLYVTTTGGSTYQMEGLLDFQQAIPEPSLTLLLLGAFVAVCVGAHFRSAARG